MADITARGMAARAMASGGGGTTVDAYNKQETDNLLRGKANVTDVYSKTETGDLLEDKVDKISGKSLSTNDYTNEDMSLVKTISNKANASSVNESINNLQGQIDTVNETLTDFETEITTKIGYSLGMSIDASTYVMTMTLKNSKGSVVSTQSIDLPIESMVIDASYANGKLNLTLQNGTSLSVDISSIVSGLVKDTFKIAGIDMKDNIEANELRTALGVYTTTEVDNKLGQKANASTTYSKTEVDNKVSTINTNIQANTTAINATNERVTQNESDILSVCVGMGLIEVKNLFNKDGEINSTYSGSVVSNTSADFNTVNGNVITFNRNSSTSQPTGQFIRNLKNKKIIVSFNVVSFGTGTTVAFRAFERGNGTPIVNEYPNKIGAFKYTIDIDKEEVLFGFATSGGRGAQIENIMIRYAEITDDTYAPFTGLDLQGQIYTLTDRIKALETLLAQTTVSE